MGLKGWMSVNSSSRNCKSPKDAVIGRRGRLSNRHHHFTVARPSIGPSGWVSARALSISALKYAKERVLYGKPISRLQAVQFMLAEMDTEIEAARWLVYQPGAVWTVGYGPATSSNPPPGEGG